MDSDHFSKHNSRKHQGRAKYEDIVEAKQTRLSFVKVKYCLCNFVALSSVPLLNIQWLYRHNLQLYRAPPTHVMRTKRYQYKLTRNMSTMSHCKFQTVCQLLMKFNHRKILALPLTYRTAMKR